MFSVGLDVDTLVSIIMVTLFFSLRLYAGKLDYLLGPLSYLLKFSTNTLFGKIQSYKFLFSLSNLNLLNYLFFKNFNLQYSFIYIHIAIKFLFLDLLIYNFRLIIIFIDYLRNSLVSLKKSHYWGRNKVLIFLLNLIFFLYLYLIKNFRLVNEQSAGNSLNNTELNRLIPEKYHISDHLKKHNKPTNNNDFGYYISGLIEGKGSFCEHRLEIEFKIEDVSLAYFIKKQIGYGKVIKNSNTVKYSLTHSEGLKKVLYLINGKILTNKIIKQLLKHNYNSKFNVNFQLLPENDYLDIFSNYWLAGFTDAVGNFSINIFTNNNINNNSNKFYPLNNNFSFNKLDINSLYFSLEFYITHNTSDILELIKNKVGGEINVLDSDELFQFKANNIFSAKTLINYFDIYQLNSYKFVNYFKWRKIYRILQRNEHLQERGIIKILRIKKNLRD